MNKLLIALLCCVCLGASAAHGEPELTIVAHVFPPFQFKRNNEIVGPMVKIMELACVEAQIKCTVTMNGYRDSYQQAKAGTADVIYTFLLDDDDKERESLFYLSVPIVDTSYSFFVLSTSNWKWTGKSTDLENRTIGVYGPSGTSIIAKRAAELNPTAKLVLEESNLKVFQQLIIGKYGDKATVVACTEVGEALLKSANIYGPKPAGEIAKAKFGFGYSKASKHPELFFKLNAAITVLKKKGIIKKILETNETPLIASM